MSFDTTTALIVAAILAALILAFLVLRPRPRAGRIERKPDAGAYVASRDRPYMNRRAAAVGPRGNSVADEVATAATDVAGHVLGVAVRSEPRGAADDFHLLKGVGPKFAARLNELGVTRFTQLAALSDNGIALLDEKLGPFSGRLARDRVPEQACFLARGDIDGFEERFGKLGG